MLSHIEVVLIKITAIMFILQSLDSFLMTLQEWVTELLRYISASGDAFKTQGVSIMICTAAGFYKFSRSKPGNISLSLIR